MTKIKTLTEEAQLTDSEGWTYRREDNRPDTAIPQIMNLLYTTELEEELDWLQMLTLAAYVSNVDAWSDLTPERLSELWTECEENYEGSHANGGEFAEYFMEMTGQLNETATADLVIDWEATYNYSLRYDYFDVYVYAKNTETNALEIERFFFRSC
jgi:hypothetical protein